MNNPKIKSIKEAYSMQPVMLSVRDRVAPNVVVAKIELMDIFSMGDPIPHYVGFDALGRKLFQYKADSVNVHFETEAI